MSRPDGQLTSLRGETGDASNVLLLAPSMGEEGDEGCSRLLTVEPEESKDVLSITLTESPDDRLAVWRRHASGRPARTGFVNVGDPTRSVSADSGGSIELPGRDMTIETVSSPADLTGIGIKVSSFLSEWAEDGNSIVVCFHSLTTLLQYIDLQEAFRFLHVLTGRLEAVDAVAHYHMDPDAHDEREVNTLKALFDAVVEVDGDGEWTVRTR